MPIALDPRRETKYVLACDRELPTEKQTKFFIRPLTIRQHAEWQDSIMNYDAETKEVKTNYYSNILTLLRFGLIGCSDFFDSEGREVRFAMRNGQVSDEFLERLSPEHRYEIATAIKDLSTPSERDLGGSSSAQP